MEPEEEGNGNKRKLSPFLMAHFSGQGNEQDECMSTEISLQDLSHQRIRQALVLVMLHYSTIGSY